MELEKAVTAAQVMFSARGSDLIRNMPCRLDIEAMTVAQLKEECRARGLTVSGNKSDLQARLRGAAAPPPAEPRRVMTVEQLKDECRTRGLAVSGTKADLEARLRGEDPPPPAAPDGPYGGLTATQLKEALKERGLPVTGKKAELIAKLVANDKEKLMPELEEKSHKERLDGNGGKAGPKKDPNLPLLLVFTSRLTRIPPSAPTTPHLSHPPSPLPSPPTALFASYSFLLNSPIDRSVSMMRCAPYPAV